MDLSGYQWAHPTLSPEEWLLDYSQREKKPKPWTQEEWVQDWADALVAKYCRELARQVI